MKLLVDNLTCVRGGRDVLQGVSFSVAGGAGLKLTGVNGSGKTTLLRTVAGFLRPGSGSVDLEGGAVDRELAEQLHYVGHLDGVKTALTVHENLAFWQRFLTGRQSDDVLRVALDKFSLNDLAEIPAGYLSAGQRRRLGLSRLLVAERPIWLLDEPTVSLDRQSQAVVGDVVNEHLARGGIVVAATHVPLAMDLGDELELGRQHERVS